MDTKWTPGPWRAEVVAGWGGDPVITADTWPKPVAMMVPHTDRYYQHVKRQIRGERVTTFLAPTTEGESRKAEVDAQLAANAHLIAAAPDLYAALDDLLAAYAKPDERLCCGGQDCGCQGATAYQQAEYYARAALSKARGEA